MKRFIKLLKARFFSKDPFFVLFHVTARCNAHCWFCFNWDNVSTWQQRQDLTLDEIDKISQNMGNTYQLTISGGEPFLRQDLPEIISLFHKNCDVQTVTIPTNAVLTDRVKTSVERIISENPDIHLRIGLSVPEIGDELTDIYGVKDAFRKHQETYAELVKLLDRYSNLTLNSGICCSKYNSGRIKQILDYIYENMSKAKAHVAYVRGKPQCADALDITFDEVEDVYAYHQTLFHDRDNRPFGNALNVLTQMVNEITLKMIKEPKAPFPCRSGEKLIVIYDNGDVFPCEILEEKKIGNLREYNYSLKDLLRSHEAKDTVDWIINTKCHCTWECSNHNNIIFSWPWMLRLSWRGLKGAVLSAAGQHNLPSAKKCTGMATSPLTIRQTPE